MALFRRKTQPAPAEVVEVAGSGDPEDGRGDLATLVLQGYDMIEQVAAIHQRWGLGESERWDVDQETALITWTFADGRIATAPVQVIGSFESKRPSTWRWAWANESVQPPLRLAAEQVRIWGSQRSRAVLTNETVRCDIKQAADLSALAFRIAHGTGFYRSPGTLTTYFMFGEVTITETDGTVSHVRLNLGE